MSDSIAIIANKVHRIAKEKGWWEGEYLPLTRPEVIGSKIALIHSELSEALEEIRLDGTFFYMRNKKPEGVAIELADAVIRIFDLAEAMGIDISGAIVAKMKYNESREYRHGNKKL